MDAPVDGITRLPNLRRASDRAHLARHRSQTTLFLSFRNRALLRGPQLRSFLTFEDFGADEKRIPETPKGVIEDRKSTRLNSSHGYISYAVFCLKKKKKTRR